MVRVNRGFNFVKTDSILNKKSKVPLCRLKKETICDKCNRNMKVGTEVYMLKTYVWHRTCNGKNGV